MEDNKKIIEEFINGTPHWLELMSKMKQDKGCAICGVVPNNVRALVIAIKELKEKADMYDSLDPLDY